MLSRLFTAHPASVGESYVEHMGMAFGFSLRLALAALACLVHALLPFLFVRTGSDCIHRLNQEMVENRKRPSPAEASEAA